MKYSYVRVSSQTQNIARQIEGMYKLGWTDDVDFWYFDYCMMKLLLLYYFILYT